MKKWLVLLTAILGYLALLPLTIIVSATKDVISTFAGMYQSVLFTIHAPNESFFFTEKGRKKWINRVD